MEGQLHPALARDLAGGKPGHAYLLIGKSANAQAALLAMALNCFALRAGLPCGKCPACHKSTSGNFIDCYIFKPEKGSIKIEQMRSLQKVAVRLPVEGQKTVVIIEDADALQEAAANSLLKILEEPPLSTVLILAVQNPDKLPLTVISRCRSYFLGAESTLPAAEKIEQAQAQAEEFLLELQQKSVADILLFTARFDKDKEAFMAFLLALWQILSEMAAGRRECIFDPAATLKSAAFTERALDLQRRNANQRLLTDVYFLRLAAFLRKRN